MAAKAIIQNGRMISITPAWVGVREGPMAGSAGEVQVMVLERSKRECVQEWCWWLGQACRSAGLWLRTSRSIRPWFHECSDAWSEGVAAAHTAMADYSLPLLDRECVAGGPDQVRLDQAIGVVRTGYAYGCKDHLEDACRAARAPGVRHPDGDRGLAAKAVTLAKQAGWLQIRNGGLLNQYAFSRGKLPWVVERHDGDVWDGVLALALWRARPAVVLDAARHAMGGCDTDAVGAALACAMVETGYGLDGGPDDVVTATTFVLCVAARAPVRPAWAELVP